MRLWRTFFTPPHCGTSKTFQYRRSMRGGVLYSPSALCLGIYSNRFVFEEMQFDWRPALLPSNFAARSSYFASAISQSLPATNTGGAVSSIHGRRWPMLCGLLVRHMLWLSTIISANTNVIWHWNWLCSCHGKTDECDAGGGALKRAVDVRVFSPGLFR